MDRKRNNFFPGSSFEESGYKFVKNMRSNSLKEKNNSSIFLNISPPKNIPSIPNIRENQLLKSTPKLDPHEIEDIYSSQILLKKSINEY